MIAIAAASEREMNRKCAVAHAVCLSLTACALARSPLRCDGSLRRSTHPCRSRHVPMSRRDDRSAAALDGLFPRGGSPGTPIGSPQAQRSARIAWRVAAAGWICAWLRAWRWCC